MAVGIYRSAAECGQSGAPHRRHCDDRPFFDACAVRFPKSVAGSDPAAEGMALAPDLGPTCATTSPMRQRTSQIVEDALHAELAPVLVERVRAILILGVVSVAGSMI